jgi:NAD+ synthase (glutamine-hydrolysing)
MFFQHHLHQQSLVALTQLLLQTTSIDTIIIIGMALPVGNRLFNTALVLQGGQVLGVVPKTNMPNHNEFYEKRWFASAHDAVGMDTIEINGKQIPFGTNIIFTDGAWRFSIEICEDIWMPISPSIQHAMHGADVIFNLSASTEMVGKSAYRHKMIGVHSRRCMAGYVYVSCGAGESTSDVVFGGDTLFAENGHIIAALPRFTRSPQLLINEIDIDILRHERYKNTNFEGEKSNTAYQIIHFTPTKHATFTLTRKVEPLPFVPSGTLLADNCQEVFNIQTSGLAQRWQHAAKSVVVGISGGLDSTLALLVCRQAAEMLNLPYDRVIAITMPGMGTTSRTRNNAQQIASALGVTLRTIPIEAACIQHFKDIGHDPSVHNIVYENAQARERTQVLMDIANAEDALVVGTGDMSELALGWATYGGDLASMYNVNAGVPKTLIPHLIKWIATNMNQDIRNILNDIIATPISPELLPANNTDAITQITEELIGPYDLHDFFLFYMIRFGITPTKLAFLAQQAFADKYDTQTIIKWLQVFLHRFFQQQYKRSCTPDSPKIGTVNLAREVHIPSDMTAFAFTPQE